MFGEVPHFGVFCSSHIAKGARFGPFQGKVVNASEVKTYGDNSLMWEVNIFLVGWLKVRRRLVGKNFGVCPSGSVLAWERDTQGSNLLSVLPVLQHKGKERRVFTP